MNKEDRQRRLVLTVKPGESIRVQVSDGRWLIVRRDQRDPNKLIFEEITALAEKPYFRISRERSAAMPGDKSVASHEPNARTQNRIGEDAQAGI